MSTEEANRPDFESIRQVSEQGIEYWSARDLSKLLGYAKMAKNLRVLLTELKLRVNK